MSAASSSTWVAGLEDEARRVLSAETFRYISQGSREGLSAAEAAAAWRRYRFLPRAFADVREVDLTSSFLGSAATMPLGVAPTTFQRAAHPEGEVAMARGCREAGVPLVLSSNATATLEEIGAVGATWWLQAYVTEDRHLIEPLLDRAIAAGASAIVLTVDTPVVGTKYDDGAIWAANPRDWVRPNLGAAADAPKARDLGPDDIARLAGTGLPVVVKGVLHPDDAAVAVEAGAAAVWVSNHGGRQLDRVLPTAHCLAEVAEKVGSTVPVYVDGGVRSGLDVLTALALGADACFLGRPALYALSLEGAEGVTRLFETLGTELAEAFRLVGATRPDTLSTRVQKPQIGP